MLKPEISQDMTPEVTDAFESYKRDSDENFTINSEIEILYILRKIIQKNTLVTMYFDQDNQFILTSILAINTKTKEMLLDYGIEEELNQAALNKNKLIFITSQDRIKIEFACNSIRKVKFENRDAFVVNIPDSLLRMQRRNHFRISTPVSKPLKCIIPIKNGDEEDVAEITLLDISCGGIGVIDHHPAISFDPGTVYDDCRIELPEIGTIKTSIEVRNTYEMTLKNGLACKRAGCQFTSIAETMRATVQRYIIKLEQQRKQADLTVAH